MDTIIFKEYKSTEKNIVKAITEPTYHNTFDGFKEETIQLIYLQDTLVGWIHLHIPEVFIHSGFVFVYVKPEYRRQGIGTYAYRQAEIKLKEFGGNWWSSYPELEAADQFAMHVGFDYTNTNSYLVHDGRNLTMDETGIRQAKSEDYPTAPDIWGKEYAAMHKRLGLPFEQKEMTEEERKEDFKIFLQMLNLYFVMEVDGIIVGMGTLFDDDSGIGGLAVDEAYAGKGYGTRIAAFLTNECIRRGCPNPCLYCETGNDNAMHIYKKIGYVEKSRESVAVKN